LVTFHPLSTAKETFLFRYSINGILVSIVNFLYICFAQCVELSKNWFFYGEYFCC
jgi:hypothetical protein